MTIKGFSTFLRGLAREYNHNIQSTRLGWGSHASEEEQSAYSTALPDWTRVDVKRQRLIIDHKYKPPSIFIVKRFFFYQRYRDFIISSEKIIHLEQILLGIIY